MEVNVKSNNINIQVKKRLRIDTDKVSNKRITKNNGNETKIINKIYKLQCQKDYIKDLYKCSPRQNLLYQISCITRQINILIKKTES